MPAVAVPVAAVDTLQGSTHRIAVRRDLGDVPFWSGPAWSARAP
jgi:hypothetical protein